MWWVCATCKWKIGGGRKSQKIGHAAGLSLLIGCGAGLDSDLQWWVLPLDHLEASRGSSSYVNDKAFFAKSHKTSPTFTHPIHLSYYSFVIFKSKHPSRRGTRQASYLTLFTMAKGKEELSHEEIWDDSALIDSWNSALDEYKVRID